MNSRLERERIVHRHIAELVNALEGLTREAGKLTAWGDLLADTLTHDGRVLTAGNGGSAAHAQHLASELVGRYRADRPAYSAVALSAEPSTVTAIVNDYGADVMFARQVEAHGRPGDIFIGFSTSGRSANVLAATRVAREKGMYTWALTGATPNALAQSSDDALSVASSCTATVQEVHQVALHLICEAFEAHVVNAGRTVELAR